MVGLLLRRPSPFAYPGTRPGFDPNHVAAQGTIFSAVSSAGGSATSLLASIIPTNGGTAPLSVIDGLGYVTFFNAASTVLSFTGAIPAVIQNPITMAAIVRLTSTSSTTFINSSGVGTKGWRLEYNGSAFRMVSNAVSALSSGIAMVANTPYFVAASAGTGSSSFVVLNLSTGQIQTATAGGTGTPVASDGVAMYGGIPQGNNVKLAAGMMAASQISVAALKQWAQDPWLFWYPNNFLLSEMLRGPAAAGGGLKYYSSLNGLGASGPFFHDRLAS